MSFLIMDLEGLCLSDVEKDLLKHPSITGVILFQRNFADLTQLKNLIRSIREIIKCKNGLIAIDQEGGRVQRLTTPFTTLPAPGIVSEQLGAKSIAQLLCHELGWLMASEMKSVDIDISFAPVLDVDIGVSEVIGKRSFGNHADTVISLATAYIRGMSEAGMAATGKHFPGHGGVKADSHKTSPIDQRSYEQLYQSELRVFEALIKTGISGLMPSHVIYQEVDPSPPCFSHFWLRHILRNEYNFYGCIFSDDLSMQGATVVGNASERATMALEAGCDVLLCCNDRKSVIEILDNVHIIASDIQQRRVNALTNNAGYNSQVMTLDELQNSQRYSQLMEKLAQLET